MATSSTFVCDVCDSQHITKEAEHWCPECEEGLCPKCLIFHNSSKLSRGHSIISIENYKQLPQFIRSIRQQCQDHDRKYQHYCPSHEVPCCPYCMTTSHSKCNGLQVLEEVVKTSALSSQYEDMKQSLRDVGNNIEKIKIDREDNVKSIQEQRKKFQSEISQVRQQINDHLDKLEKQAMDNLKSTEDKVKCQIEKLLSKLSFTTKNVEDLENIITAMSSYASDLQNFLGLKQIESQVTTSEKYISSLVLDGSLQHLSLNCSIESNVSEILSSISSLCTISTQTSSSNILLTTEKEKQAQIMTVPRIAQTSINDIKIELVRMFTLPRGKGDTHITGCTITPSGKMVFTDYTLNNRLIFCKADGTLDCELLSMAYDVTSIDDGRVAIIQEKTIQIIDFSSKETEATIKIRNGEGSGISYMQNKLLYCEPLKGIHMLKLTDGSDYNYIAIDNKNSVWNFVASTQNNIYHTNMNTNIVTCYKVTGEKLWDFKDTAVIRVPCGVAVDKYSNVYVASTGNNSIVVISPDGSQRRTLISNVKSWAIDIDKENNTLIVAEFLSSHIRVYKIS